MQQYINASVCYVPVIGLVEKKILFQETDRINSLVGETYTLTMHIIYGDKFNNSIFMYRESTVNEVKTTFWIIRKNCQEKITFNQGI